MSSVHLRWAYRVSVNIPRLPASGEVLRANAQVFPQTPAAWRVLSEKSPWLLSALQITYIEDCSSPIDTHNHRMNEFWTTSRLVFFVTLDYRLSNPVGEGNFVWDPPSFFSPSIFHVAEPKLSHHHTTPHQQYQPQDNKYLDEQKL